MKAQNSNEVQSEAVSQQELSAKGKSLSEDKDNSHGGKYTKDIFSYKDSLKKENASGTGYLDDNDDDYDEWFQDA